MSYILDALKKVEQEKSRKSRTTGKINITGELFGGERSRPVEGRRLKTVLLVAAAVLFTFGATWFLLTGSGDRKRATMRLGAAKLPPAASIATTVPTASVAAPPVPVAPVQPTVTPAPAPAVITAPVPVSAANPVVSAADDEDEGERRRSRRPQAKTAASSQTLKTPVLASVPAPADIKVSGIAWQDERRARRAVVNGFLMREGAIVSGAKITEILQDRVRFSLSGTTFEVTFISAGMPGAGK
jgi:general secretion pathway protein B